MYIYIYTVYICKMCKKTNLEFFFFINKKQNKQITNKSVRVGSYRFEQKQMTEKTECVYLANKTEENP